MDFKFEVGQRLFIKGTNLIVTVVGRRYLPEAGDTEPLYCVDKVYNGYTLIFRESELTAD